MLFKLIAKKEKEKIQEVSFEIPSEEMFLALVIQCILTAYWKSENPPLCLSSLTFLNS